MLENIKNAVFTTEGRLNRLRYFKYTLILGLCFGIVGFIVGRIFPAENSFVGDTLQTLLTIPMAVGSVMLQIRRLHDLDRSGWFVLISAIPGINFLFGIYLLLAKGTDGTNRYGYDPLLMD